MAEYGNYKQYDSRWGKINYNGSSNYATAGCGPTSVANLAYAVDKSVTPLTVGKYMQKHGYAVPNHGTAWSGIPAAMKSFGLQNVQWLSAMSDVFNSSSKGYCNVFLFKAGSRGGVCWTTSGHYVAVTDYTVSNGKHYFYTRDSGGRDHTGWYCYETQMKGLIKHVWTGKVQGVTPTPTPTPTGKLTVDGKFGPASKKAMQKWLGVKQDGVIGKATTKALQKKVGANVDGVWGAKTTKKLQIYLTKMGYKVDQDGFFGVETIKALQRFLNDKVL